MTTKTRPGIRTALPVILSMPVEPVRPVTGCEDCDNGCHCEGGVEGIGCEHWGCWGRTATNDCAVGAAALREHMHAYTAYRRALHAYFAQ